MVRIGLVLAKRMIDDRKCCLLNLIGHMLKNILKCLSALDETGLSFLKKQAFAVKMFLLL